MKIFAIGDVVGRRSIEYLSDKLRGVASKLGADFVVCNGENASEIHGLCKSDAQALLDCGVDLITLGNHAFGSRDIYTFLDDNTDRIIRPANYPAACPGVGYTLREVSGLRILCMNLSGTAFMDPLDNPFTVVDRILDRERGEYDIALLDFSAPHLIPCHNVISSLVFSVKGGDVAMTMVKGKILYQNGHFPTIDLKHVVEEITTYAIPRLFADPKE